MRLCNVSTSFTGPQSSPLLIHDVSCGGGAERKAGAATHLVPRGAVMKNHSRCHKLDTSGKEPFGHGASMPLLIMAPPHSACRPLIIFGFTLKVLMWGDAVEGLTHDDERRDVKDGIRSQIMEIEPVIEHKPSNKGIKAKA